tara:strand:+ start:14507 stop:15973 length:1467 start_codon:yes stop_codon:yes gene_type:complete
MADLTLPIGDNGVGEDPFYDDDFYQVKNEAGKIGNTDFGLIRRLSETVLSDKAKDIRIIVYLAFARANLDGVSGLLETMQLLTDLIKQYPDTIHPTKMSARIAAVKWLDSEKLHAFIQEQVVNASKEQLDTLLSAIDELNNLMSGMSEDYNNCFGQLKTILLKQTATFKPVEAVVEQSDDKPAEIRESNAGVAECASETELLISTRKQIDYLYSQEQWLRAAAYVRALCWGDLRSLPHNNHVTYLEAPKFYAIEHLQSLINAGEPLELYQYCEEMMLEQGGDVYLDLQFHASQAARNMGQDDLALFIELAVQALLRRIPNLSQLSFDDNRPFASVQCQSWLEKLVSANSGTQKSSSTQSSFHDVVNSLRAKMGDKDLAGKIHYINELMTRDRRTHFQYQLALGRFCIEENREDLAIPVLERLVNMAAQYQLADWEPNLAMAAWVELRKAIKAKSQKGDGLNEERAQQRLDELFTLMCQTDTAAAMAIA